MKLSKRKLIKAGYREYEKHKFQKCIKDSKGKRYFINIKYYDLTNELKGHKVPKSVLKGYTCDLQFQNTELPNSDICPNFNIDITWNVIEEVDAYIEKLWIVSGCPYYGRF